MHHRTVPQTSRLAAQPSSVSQHRPISCRPARRQPNYKGQTLAHGTGKPAADARGSSERSGSPFGGLQRIILQFFPSSSPDLETAQQRSHARTADENTKCQQAPPAAPDALSAAHPEAQWAAAWQAFEEGQSAEEQKPAAGGGRQKTNRSRQASHRRQEAVESVRVNPADSSSDLPAARLALQGLDSRAKIQLLVLSLSALEQQIAALPDQVENASEAEWQLLVPALLASCSLAAAKAWLGYVPAQLQQEAAQVIGQLSAGSAKSVLERSVDVAPASVVSSADSDATPDAATKERTLWPGASKRVMLHASTIRYLRFGPRRPPVPVASPAAAADTFARASTPRGSTAQQAGSVQPAAAQAKLDVAGVPMRQLARQRLVAAPSGVRGWRHHSLAEAWQGSTAANGPAVLHDLAVCTAEAVAQAYLAEARAGMAGGPARPDLLLLEGCWPVFLHRSLASSRALERFRNQLAFKRWTDQRYWEVVAIYEDRHEVAVVGAGGRLMRKSIPFKRTKELEALAGWSAAVCLLMEVNDVAAPLLQNLFTQVSAALQWLLTALIGRGLGLIFRGIRQSFRRQPPRADNTGPAPAFI